MTEAADGGSRRGHRTWRYLVPLAAGLLAVGGILWFLWLPRYRPALKPNERYGVDVSHHQGSIDWNRVASAGMSFAYIKATEGGDLLDPAFARNWSGAEEAGLDRGAYHFFTLCSPAEDQAANFLRSVPPQPPMLPRVLEAGAVLAGRYHLERELGKGGMGRVLVARDEKLGRRVAVYSRAEATAFDFRERVM